MEHDLTLGAHLLLWVFPVVLAVAVTAHAFVETRRGADR